MSKRGKAFYRGNAKKGGYGGGKLQVGMRGVILTCAMSGRMLAQACREVRDALTEYAPPPVAPEIKSTVLGQETATVNDTTQLPSDEVGTGANGSESEKGSMDVDIDDELNFEDELKKELSELKSTSTKKGRQERQRFLSIPTGCRGVEFVRFNDVNASEMVHKLMSIAEETQQSPCKLVSKLLPVTHSCKSHLKDIERSAREMLSEIFIDEKAPTTTYQIQFKTRNNDSIKKQDIYTCFTALIHETSRTQKHSVDLKNPKHVIICEVLKTVCCMSVVKDFTRFKMYNISRIVGTHQSLNIGAVEGGSFKRGDDGGAACPMTDDEVLERLKLRQKCKKKKDYLNADKIQEQLLNKGIQIFDKDKVWKYENLDGEELDTAASDSVCPQTEGDGEAAGNSIEQQDLNTKSLMLFSEDTDTPESSKTDDKTAVTTDNNTEVKTDNNTELTKEMKSDDSKATTATDDDTAVVVVDVATSMPTSKPVVDMDTSEMGVDVVAKSETQSNKQSNLTPTSESVDSIESAKRVESGASVEPLKSEKAEPSETENVSVVAITPAQEHQQVATDSHPVKRQAEDDSDDVGSEKRPKIEGTLNA
eukprot:m.105473 g.105473  ORF g.105473 m.105473 type:complete len:592 (-) comp27650_c1_seq1:54-1829(-)